MRCARKRWDALSADQKKAVQDAAKAATAQNTEQRLADEKQVTDRLKTQGLTVTPVDMKPFHDNADKVYAASDLAKALEQGSAGADRGDKMTEMQRPGACCSGRAG